MRVPLWLLNPMLRVAVKGPLRLLRSPQALRERFERHAARAFRLPSEAQIVEERIRRPEGGHIDALWTSLGRPDRHRVVLYFHGGAFLAGSPRTHKHLGAALAGAAKARVLLPAYRLAPENPFPAGVDDAEICYRDLLARGYAPGRIALAGDSAGGGLAAAAVLRIASAGLPRPGALVAFSPWADLTGSSDSLRRNATRDPMLPVGRMPEVIKHYLEDAPAALPEASPVFGRFADPPPALLFASRSEILADDARRLAEALRKGGGDVQLELWPRLPHAWPVFAGRLEASDRAVTLAGDFLRRRIGSGATEKGEPAQET
jgi:acetyl esterase/lipase